MDPRVIAVVVARGNADHLRRTMESIAAQTRQPDQVIAVACDATAETKAVLEEFGPSQIVTSRENLNFGQAIAAAVRVTDQPESESEFLWLLAQDTAPSPTALEHLLAAFEVAPSVAVAGPKNMDWNDAKRLRAFGQSITPYGATVSFVDDELDQGQHDAISDVLAVTPPGMLVRHQTWDKLGGFDPALGPVDDALDFCVRVRLAGRRVTVVAGAEVATAGDGIAGPSRATRWSARQRRVRQARTAQLHRRMVYAPGFALFLHWLSIVPLAIVRSVMLLFRKQPELIGAEFRSAFRVAFGGTHVGAARRRLAAGKSVGWSALTELRTPFREVRRQRQLEREETSGPVTRQERSDLRFLGGGAWVVLASALAGAVLFIRLLPATTLSGGGLLPLSSTIGDLWGNIGYGWRDIGAGFVGAADPFAAVLAVFGTLTFWQPSYILVLLWVLALPLATFGAWMASTRLTERNGYRILAAILWTIAPTFLFALIEGRPAAVLVHLLLPWLFYAGAVASRSWAASAAASILLAAVGACAPSLAPALVVIWALALLLAGKRMGRLVFIPVPLLALFAPLIWQQGIVAGNWIALLADPGKPLASPVVERWQLALGFPSDPAGGWALLAANLHIPESTIAMIVPWLFVPLALSALAGLFLRGGSRVAVMLLVALLGLGSAVASTHVLVTAIGTDVTSIWPGPALSLYALGLIGAVTASMDSLRVRGAVPALATGLAMTIVAVPLIIAVPLGHSDVVSSDGRTLPAYVTAAASVNADVGTLRITPQANGSIVATVVRGAGETLDTQSTLVNTGAVLTDEDGHLATLAGNLVSISGLDAAAQLEKLGVQYVLVAPSVPAGTQVPQKAGETSIRAAAALDANPAFEPVGQTDAGLLWRALGDTAADHHRELTPALSSLVLAGLIAVFAIALLVAIPTRASIESARRNPRTVGRRFEPGEYSSKKRGDDDDESSPSLLDDPDAEDDSDWEHSSADADEDGLEPEGDSDVESDSTDSTDSTEIEDDDRSTPAAESEADRGE